MKKVLFISYYWPPSGGSGVQRPLKFVKYLREFGWEPVVYTSSNGEVPEIDQSLLKEVPEGITVLKQPILEPYSIYKFFTGKKGKEKIDPNFFSRKKVGWKDKLAIWIRSNFFIPDARQWWINPSTKYLVDYIKENKIDAIISTGPPHSMHLIALNLKRKTGLPWLADFRDPWTNIDYFKNLILTEASRKKHQRLEKEVLAEADKVIIVGKTWGEELEVIAERKVDIITNGYDEADFQLNPRPELDAKFSIVHLGMFSKGRNHEVFWKVIKNIADENADFKNDILLKFYGKYDVSAVEYMNKYDLGFCTGFYEYVPHNEIIKVQYSSQVLYLSVNDTPNVKGIMTGKVFEYMAVKRPILCIGPNNGDAAEIINSTKSGFVSEFLDEVTLKQNILKLYYNYKNNIHFEGGVGLEQFTRKGLTKQLATFLNEIATTNK